MKYENLVKVIELNDINYLELAKELNITVDNLKEKLEGNIDFILKEVEIILSLFPNLSFKYLFYIKGTDLNGI